MTQPLEHWIHPKTVNCGIINGVLHNFLKTYTSRNTDYHGYCLFGMLVDDLSEIRIDLLSSKEGTIEDTPTAAVVRFAIQKFREQVIKAGATVSLVREAYLHITKLPDVTNGLVNGRMCAGHTVRFVAKVVSKHGKLYEREMSLFVAPHDPRIEIRSVRVG